MAAQFYANLFASEGSRSVERVLQHIDAMVTEEMNAKLCAPFTDKEIEVALFQMGPTKAPGPDGFPARFFQRHWSVMKDKIVAAVKLFFATRVMPEGVNSTTIILIPKVDSPTGLSDFWPISLCNVIYKVIAKCLVNRLRPILDEIVSPVQSAFVPGWLITDNILMAYEISHFLMNKRAGKEELAAVKVDMSKAYDRVEWSFLEAMMI